MDIIINISYIILMNLQYISTKQLLADIPINDVTHKAIDEYLSVYLSQNPHIIETYLNSNCVYNVFFRAEDPDGLSHERFNGIIYLLKTFVTLKCAHQWILDNGKNITQEQTENYGRPIVLTIIPSDNMGADMVEGNPTEIFMISTKRYMTYAFAKENYQMLLKEHNKMICGDWQNEIIPYWINYYKNGKLMQGCRMKDLEDIFKDLTYINNDVEKKDQHRKDLLRFHKNPQKYIRQKEIIWYRK